MQRQLVATALGLTLSLAADSAWAQGAGWTFEHVLYADAAGAALRYPEGVACTAEGRMVVADTGNARLVSYRLAAGGASGGTAVKLAVGTSPTRVQIDSQGHVWVLDQRARRVIRVGVDGAVEQALDLKHLPKTPKPLPVSFKLDSADRVVLLDLASRRVWLLNPTGEVQRELALPTPEGLFTDVAVGRDGQLYLLEAKTSTVYVASPSGKQFIALTKSLKDLIKFPTYLVASGKTLWLVDAHSHGLVALSSEGAFLGRQLSMGHQEGMVYYPGQVCLDTPGHVWVSDRGNHRVQSYAIPK